MLDTLIAEGESLKSKVVQKKFLKYFETVEFEEWIAKVVFYLEENKPNSTVTSRVSEKYSKMNVNNNFEVYNMALGALKSLN